MNEPIKSGWRGNLNGYVEGAKDSTVHVSHVDLCLDRETAWALCNMLMDERIKSAFPEEDQKVALSNLGAAIGRLIDHPAANNGGREIIK